MVAVDGSKIEATDGQTVTMCFDIDEVEKADLVKVSFKGDDEVKRLIAQRPNWPFDDPPPAGVSMIVEKGRVCVTIQKVDNSSSGLYEARVFREKMSSVEVQLIVNRENQAALSTIAPPQTSTPKPVTSDLCWLWALIPLVVIVILGVVYFLKRRKVSCFQDQEPVAVIVMDCCKENGKALLSDNIRL